MNDYTVLLLRPDYMADEFGKDTYLAHVSANGAQEAQCKAQAEVISVDYEGEPDDGVDPTDYHVLFVASGHHEDLSL